MIRDRHLNVSGMQPAEASTDRTIEINGEPPCLCAGVVGWNGRPAGGLTILPCILPCTFACRVTLLTNIRYPALHVVCDL